jgi:hypothetical protein
MGAKVTGAISQHPEKIPHAKNNFCILFTKQVVRGIAYCSRYKIFCLEQDGINVNLIKYRSGSG